MSYFADLLLISYLDTKVNKLKFGSSLWDILYIKSTKDTDTYAASSLK